MNLAARVLFGASARNCGAFAAALALTTLQGPGCATREKANTADGTPSTSISATSTAVQPGVEPAVATGLPEGVAEVIHRYPEVLKSGEVMVDDTWVYFSNGDALWRAKKDGTSELREKMGPNGMRAISTAIAQDADRVYWVYEHHIVAVSKSTLEVTTFEFEDVGPTYGALLVDSGVAYVSSSNCERIAKVPLDGSTPGVWHVRSGLEGMATTLAVDSEYLYCGTGAADTIHRIDRMNGAAIELIPDSPTPRLAGIGGIALDGAYVYWVEQVSHSDDGPIRLLRSSKNAPNFEELMTLPTGNANRRLTLHDNGKLYWVSGGLNRYDLATNEYRYLMQYVGHTGDAAFDAKYVYWAQPGIVFRASLEALEAAPPVPFLFETRQVARETASVGDSSTP